MKKKLLMMLTLLIVLGGCISQGGVNYEDLDKYVSVQDYNGEFMSFERYINNDVYGHEEVAFPAIEKCVKDYYGYDVTAEALATYEEDSAIVYVTMDEPIQFTSRILTSTGTNFETCISFAYEIDGDVNSAIYASAYEDTLEELDKELELIKDEYGLVSRNEGTFSTGSHGHRTENYFVANDLSNYDLNEQFDQNNYELTPEYILDYFEGTTNEELIIGIHLFEDTPGAIPSKEEADEIITRINDKFGNDRIKFRLRIYTNEVIQTNGRGKDGESGDVKEVINNE